MSSLNFPVGHEEEQMLKNESYKSVPVHAKQLVSAPAEHVAQVESQLRQRGVGKFE